MTEKSKKKPVWKGAPGEAPHAYAHQYGAHTCGYVGIYRCPMNSKVLEREAYLKEQERLAKLGKYHEDYCCKVAKNK